MQAKSIQYKTCVPAGMKSALSDSRRIGDEQDTRYETHERGNNDKPYHRERSVARCLEILLAVVSLGNICCSPCRESIGKAANPMTSLVR